MPELRIVDDALWQAVKARQAELTRLFEPTIIGVREARAKRMHKTPTPAFLLSGLLICGACKGRYSIVSTDRYGCRNHFRRGACGNSRTISRKEIEGRVLAGLKDKLVSPESVERAARAFYEVMNRENQERRAQAAVNRQT